VILREIIPILIACSWLSPAAAQEVFSITSHTVDPSTVAQEQDFSDTVLPITELNLRLGIEVKFGTGFCLDPACRFIGTNYHVAMMARPHKILGEKVMQRYLATGPEDEGATVNEGPSASPTKYTLSRDLAIFELRHPLPHHHGAAFNLDDLQIGQEVDIYAYPKGIVSPWRALEQVHGTFTGETSTGLLAFHYGLSPGRAIRPGASGGIVVDRKTQQIVGILNAIAKNGEAIALAVPVQSLAEFVTKVQPLLAPNIFPAIKRHSLVSADLYPKYVPPPADVLRHRPEEPYEVWVLRRKAQLLSGNMRNLIAVQTLTWGSGPDNKEPAAQAAYEVQVVDGHQRFREYPDGKREFQQIPFPLSNTVYAPAAEWSELPRMVGTEFWLDLHQAADVEVNGQRMKVFQYRASIEDGVCAWKSYLDWGLFARSRRVVAACYGEVWTDQDTNILRISQHFEELTGAWRNYQAVLTYGWLKRADEPARLVPVTFSTQAEHKKKLYWCRGQFTGYQMFGTRIKITAAN
jgi:hypothetical protein